MEHRLLLGISPELIKRLSLPSQRTGQNPRLLQGRPKEDLAFQGIVGNTPWNRRPAVFAGLMPGCSGRATATCPTDAARCAGGTSSTLAMRWAGAWELAVL